MASWSGRRKFGYFLIFLAGLVLLVGLPAFFVFYRAPTCSDGRQNGAETGIDCGGACAKLCPADYAAPRILWSYSVRIVPGIYNALAYVQNPNPSVEASGLPYLFKLYDAQGLLIVQKAGRAYIPAGQKLAVFEAGIDTGKRIVARTTFEFTGEPNWKKGALLLKLRAQNTALSQGDLPRADVDVRNDSLDTYSGVTAYIILYDANDNRVSFSKTILDPIAPNEKQTIHFTWPEAFPVPVVRTEVLFVGSGK
ncbi:MAG TPA: hypothetical protein VHD69_00880 [Candidatus Paceibacterota bacterium]|nr:hypothetical protein [Candidatus Paceibacterota bacterium]